jgi:hypothetical protein
MTRYDTFHDQSSHPDEWFCSTEQERKPKSEFNLRDAANGLPQWDCRDSQQKRERDRYRKNKDQIKNINRVAKLNCREENREYVYTYLCEHPCQDRGASDPRMLTFDHVRGTKKDHISDIVNNGWSIETIKVEIAISHD